MRTELLLASLLAAMALSGALPRDAAEVESCIDKARGYYRSISSYPTFSSGIDAEFVAREHCSRSPALFDKLSYIQSLHTGP